MAKRHYYMGNFMMLNLLIKPKAETSTVKEKLNMKYAGKKEKIIYDHTTILLPRMYLAEGDQDHARCCAIL